MHKIKRFSYNNKTFYFLQYFENVRKPKTTMHYDHQNFEFGNIIIFCATVMARMYFSLILIAITTLSLTIYQKFCRY